MTTNTIHSDINSLILNDDCLRQIFTYLTLRDRFRLERVSKQFKNWVYFDKWCLKVTNDLAPNIINEYNVINIDLFRNVCQKCSDITTIVCSERTDSSSSNVLVNDSVLDIITEFCLKLKEIYFSVNDVTEEAITRFGQRLGHRLEMVFFFNEDSSQENQQILIKLCPNLKKVVCGYFPTVNLIDSVQFKYLCLTHYHMWSESEVQAFVQFVDRYQNNFTYLGFYSNSDANNFLDDILGHVLRFTNLEDFDLCNNSELFNQILSPKFEDLGPVCMKLKKVFIDFSLDDFDLWHTFRHFDALEVLKICLFWSGSVLRDSISKIKPLKRLKKFKFQCISIGFNFFNDFKEFCPNVEILSICVHSPRHQLKNHCLTVLSECKQLKILKIEMPTNIRVLGNEEQIQHDIDDIGIFRLLDNCRDIEQIRFRFKPSLPMITGLAKWMEWEDNAQKKTITLEFVPSLDMISYGLAELYLLNNIKRLSIKKVDEFQNLLLRTNDIKHIMTIELDKDSKISIDLMTYRLSNDESDIWYIFSRHKDLEQLIFHDSDYFFHDFKPNIESLMSLKEITIECLYFDNFDNIAMLAPNLEEFQLISTFQLTNLDLNELSKLKHLTKIILIDRKSRNHSSDDIGVIQLLDSCLRLKEVLFDFEVNITYETIDKLKELANNRPKEIIRFQYLVNSPELQSNRLTGIPKNLIIQTKFNVNE